jgi:hypothetical protein
MTLHKNTVEPKTFDLLKRLMDFPEFKQFALVGGTNLSLQLGHRISIDLDIFSNESFLSNEILPQLAKTFQSFDLIRSTEKSFSGTIENIKVDVVLHQYEYINPIIEIEGVRLLSIPDIIAMKLGALSNRGAKKDFWDIAELLNHYTIAEMIDFFSRKYKNHDYGYVIHSLYYFEDAENQDDPIDLRGITWQEVKNKIKKAVDEFIYRSL